MNEILSWSINIIAVIGWLVNIKYRKWAMIIFTISTSLSILYFATTHQTPFLARSVFYLFIDAATLWSIYKSKSPTH